MKHKHAPSVINRRIWKMGMRTWQALQAVSNIFLDTAFICQY